MNITVDVVGGIDGAEDEIKATFTEGLYSTIRLCPSRNQTKETIDLWVKGQAENIAKLLEVKETLTKEYTFKDKILTAVLVKA